MAWFFRRRKKSTQTLDRIGNAGGKEFDFHGERRHVANAPYVLPSDDQEVNRLDFQHYMLRYSLGGNYAAPLDKPTGILDVGSGTGRWAMEMAQLYSLANVIGTDLVEPKSETAEASLGYGLDRRPDNYAFVKGNVLEGLPFGDNTFDFVHVRLLLFAIPAAQWPVVAREVYRVTKPGGWIESVETGPQTNGGPAMDTLVKWITDASLRRGVDPTIGPRVASFYAGAGIANMQGRSITMPVGRYGGRVGSMAEADVFGVMTGVKPLLVSQGITDAQSYDNAITQARADMERHQCTLPFYIAYGQKPLTR